MMDGLLLCKGILSETPYYCDMDGSVIYSLEELNYYIYNNIYFLSKDFFSDKLISYISDELKDEKIAQALLRMKSQNRTMGELAVALLEYTGYYTLREIKDFFDVVKKLETLTACERYKECAAGCLSSKKYAAAVRYYNKALSMAVAEKKNPDFMENIYHNMGVSYACLFLYEQAAESFLNAYYVRKSVESLKQYYYACILGGLDVPEKCDEKLYSEVQSDIEEAKKQSYLGEKSMAVKKVLDEKENGFISKYVTGCRQLEDYLKEECLNYMR